MLFDTFIQYVLLKFIFNLLFLFRNYYNFLKLKEKSQSEEEIDQINENKNAIKNENTVDAIEKEKNYDDALIYETKFPFFTSLALCLVLGFIFFKIWKIRKRIRIRKSNSFRRLSK
jgi:hypothetical protein